MKNKLLLILVLLAVGLFLLKIMFNKKANPFFTEQVAQINQLLPTLSSFAEYEPKASFKLQVDRQGQTYALAELRNIGNHKKCLWQLRDHLPKGIKAYSNWPVKQAGKDPRISLVMIPADSQWEIVRHALTVIPEYRLKTEDIVKGLRTLDDQFGVDVFMADKDGLEFTLKSFPSEDSPISEAMRNTFSPLLYSYFHPQRIESKDEYEARYGTIFLQYEAYDEQVAQPIDRFQSYLSFMREMRRLPTPQERKQVSAQLVEAEGVLKQFFQANIRPYATFDFGRAREFHCVSVLVPLAQAERDIWKLREALPPNMTAYLGNIEYVFSRGIDKQASKAEVVIAPTDSQFEIVSLARTSAGNHALTNSDIVKKLQAYDQRYGIEIYLANSDTIEFRFKRFPDDLDAFATDLAQFCTELTENNPLNEKYLAQIKNDLVKWQGVKLWWD